jgi:hypothetical protein
MIAVDNEGWVQGDGGDQPLWENGFQTGQGNQFWAINCIANTCTL